MKKKNIFAVLVVGALAASCLSSEDPYNAGFQFAKPANAYTSVYANNTRDSIVMVSYGAWQMQSMTANASWCQIPTMSGLGEALYRIPVTFEQNTTGEMRYAVYKAFDVNHTEVAASWAYIQHATRGDGSLGNAAQVKTITSSDGYTVTLSYDAQSRPLSVSIVRGDGTLASKLQIAYNESDSVLTVSTATGVLRGDMDNGYQTQRLIGERDTIGYYAQYGNFGMPLSANYAFNFESRESARKQVYAFLLNGQSLQADSVHNADSLRYRSILATNPTEVDIQKLKLTYSQTDNRCQTVDVNQLLLGMEDCHPMLLLSMFRYVRNTNIISKATDERGDITMTAELNADKSVSRLTVKDDRKGTEVVYTFTY